jgi:hypothetical protein
MVKIDIPDPPATKTMLVGLREATAPDGATVADREIVPVRLLMLFTVSVDVADAPRTMDSVLGLTDSPKLGGLFNGRNVIWFPHPPGCSAPYNPPPVQQLVHNPAGHKTQPIRGEL